jgi:hypothetical protein
MYAGNYQRPYLIGRSHRRQEKDHGAIADYYYLGGTLVAIGWRLFVHRSHLSRGGRTVAVAQWAEWLRTWQNTKDKVWSMAESSERVVAHYLAQQINRPSFNGR